MSRGLIKGDENPPLSPFSKGGDQVPPLEKGGEGGFETGFSDETCNGDLNCER